MNYNNNKNKNYYNNNIGRLFLFFDVSARQKGKMTVRLPLSTKNTFKSIRGDLTPTVISLLFLFENK